MKAVKTTYKNVTFRSSLEARWARFFDENGIYWEYEPIKFLPLSGPPYTPDFKLFNSIYVEVKPDFDSWVDSKRQKTSIFKFLQEYLLESESFAVLIGYPTDDFQVRVIDKSGEYLDFGKKKLFA